MTKVLFSLFMIDMVIVDLWYCYAVGGYFGRMYFAATTPLAVEGMVKPSWVMVAIMLYVGYLLFRLTRYCHGRAFG